MLANENYFSPENELAYMGHSQFVNFTSCEAEALAKIKGEWTEAPSTALLVGSYVDAHFEGTLDVFQARHPEIFTKSGTLKSEYAHAEKMIQRAERDDMFMTYMSGEQQVVKTGELFGIPFKIKIDSYHPGKAIVDLKCIKDFAPVWVDGEGKLPFVETWGYDFQAAIYQAIEGNHLPFFIAAITKEKPEPDLKLISIPQERIDLCLEVIKDLAPRYADIKKELIEPTRCEHCSFCKATKVLTKIEDYREI